LTPDRTRKKATLPLEGDVADTPGADRIMSNML
jgi:hypothetical protein